MTITVNMIDAIKVQFLQPIFEDDFVEKGMKAWLVDVEWDQRSQCYELFFDFNDFDAENDKYFKRSFFSNSHTAIIAKQTGRTKFTAKEAGYYEPKYSVYLGVEGEKRNDVLFEIEIKKYLREVE